MPAEGHTPLFGHARAYSLLEVQIPFWMMSHPNFPNQTFEICQRGSNELRMVGRSCYAFSIWLKLPANGVLLI
jgi:hypothetical protein